MRTSPQKNTGLLVLISSPSGGGKNTVIKRLLALFPHSAQFTTTTSRAKRPGEQDGADYFFISRQEFEKKKSDRAFLEYNEYAGNWYGTEQIKLEDALAAHDVVFSQADVNGKRGLDDKHVPHLSIFLIPENLENLRRRIAKRGGTTPKDIDKRIAIAAKEIEASKEYDYRIVNKDGEIDETVEKIRKIIEAKL